MNAHSTPFFPEFPDPDLGFNPNWYNDHTSDYWKFEQNAYDEFKDDIIAAKPV